MLITSRQIEGTSTTLRKLIEEFLGTNPIAGSPLIISLIDASDESEGTTGWEGDSIEEEDSREGVD